MTIKRKRIYEIIIISLVLMFTSLCAYMGITAVQKSMKLNMSFNVEPAILCQIDIKASGADDSTYKTIFNNVSSVIAENVSLSGNSLILSQTFLNAYKTSLGASVVLKITNLLDNDGIKVTTTASDGVNATSEVVMQKKGANGSAEIEVNVTNAGTLTLSYEICNEVTYNITYNNIVCVDATADNSANPTTYKNTDAAFLLIEPTKTGCEFLGWTYAGQNEPTKSVSIPQGTTGDLAFTANWGAELMSAEDYWNVMKSNLSYEEGSSFPGVYDVVTPIHFTATSLTYGFWEEENTRLTNYTSYGAGINIDAANKGCIKLFIEGTDLYILSPNKIISKDSNSNGLIGWGVASDLNSEISAYGSTSVSDIVIKNFSFTEMTFLIYAFSSSTAKHIDLSGLEVSSATTMVDMFYLCDNLISLDLSNFDTSNVTDMGYMFYGCNDLTTIYVSDKWSTASVTSSDGMFSGCTSLVGGDGVTKVTSTDKTNAHYNAGGYLTYKAATS